MTSQISSRPFLRNGRDWSPAAIQGAVFGFVKALADRSGAVGFRKLTGTWPGDEGPGQPEA